ncbi:MAG: IclR family transcriptional regulator [Treponema sp.]|nr:IclR family transcriptional regulator [Treponema sp.]
MSLKKKYTAPAVERVLDILELMAGNSKHYTVTELASTLNISTNSVFRILKELQTKNYLEKNDLDSSYELTPKLYFLGSRLRSRISIQRLAERFLDRVNLKTKETVLLTIFGENYSTLIVDQVESPLPIKFLSTVGCSYDSYSSAMGKLMLAYLPMEEQEWYIKNTKFQQLTPNTITNKKRFRKELEIIRERGFAFDNEESLIGLSCIAAPVFSAGGKLEGSIGISGITFRMMTTKVTNYTALLMEECKKLSATLGYEDLPQ